MRSHVKNIQSGSKIPTFFPSLWSWRDSNPRPNKEPTCFLHDYSAVVFRGRQGDERPKPALIFFISCRRRSAGGTIPNLMSTSWSNRNRESPFARCLVPPPCGRIELAYCTSAKQRERSCFRQLIFAAQIYEMHCSARRAYMTILHAVKTGQPHGLLRRKDTKFFLSADIRPYDIHRISPLVSASAPRLLQPSPGNHLQWIPDLSV